mgnify:FL=1
MFNSTSIDTSNNKGIKCDERKQHGANMGKDCLAFSEKMDVDE